MVFDFPEDPITCPAQAILNSLSKFEDADKTIFKILDNSNQLDLKEDLREPKLSYWDFEEENQLISYLYYFGSLTYAPFSEGNHSCAVKIPNKSAEKIL